MADMLVKEFYTQNVRSEWHRLVKDAYSRLELDTTLHFLDKYLPLYGSVLDAGGGPGRYTLELAKKGYEVTLLDATQANLDFARRMLRRYRVQSQVKQILQGSIVDLSQFSEGSFDAVLCSGGPLSHVLDENDRRQAISELVRVAKPGAPLFVSVMGRISLMGYFLIFAPHELELSAYELVRETGDYLGGHGFTACHFFLPEELSEAFMRPNLETIEMAGLEGISTHNMKQLNQVARNEKRYKIWLETHLQTCTHPSVVGISEHMLIVCRKIQAG
jgi:2-polyprenyl-3-methyl-5-hydroxy-6-metoxy-1,4-benzoquinol methylase